MKKLLKGQTPDAKGVDDMCFKSTSSARSETGKSERQSANRHALSDAAEDAARATGKEKLELACYQIISNIEADKGQRTHVATARGTTSIQIPPMASVLMPDLVLFVNSPIGFLSPNR